MSQGEAFQVGLRIGKYELTRKLGEGGFGVLFAARDTSLDRELAIKFLHPQHSSNQDVVKRFVQEARSIAKVVHPGVVTVYESGEVWGTGTPADGAAFIIMELLNGETLTQRMKSSGGRLAPATAMEICRQVASALEAAHRQGVVHRDLKPDNVMLVKDLALTLGERAKVLDFGIAKLATAAPSGATVAGMVFGTPNYMSPEQCRSAADANHSSDIYSLGCILFELVTGRAPFDGGMAELIAHHILTPPPVPSKIVPGLPPHIDDVVAAMLAKDPNNRPATMTVVEAILEERRLVAAPNAAIASRSGARTRTLGGARLATHPPPNFGQPMAPGERPHIPGVTPDSGPARIAATAPGAVAVAHSPATGSPTTLSSAAGIAAKLDRRSSGRWWIAVPVVVIAAVGTVLAFRGRESDGDGATPATSPEDNAAVVMDGSATTGSGTDSPTATTMGGPTTGTPTATTGGAGATTTTVTTTGVTSGTPTPGTTTTGTTTTGTPTTGTTPPGTATTTKTTGTAATTQTTGTAASSAPTTGTATKTTGTATKTTGTATKTTGTATKTTGTAAGSASKLPLKSTKTPEPAQGSAAKKCQGRSCILDGDF